MNMGMIKAALLSRSAIPPQYQRVEYLYINGTTGQTPHFSTDIQPLNVGIDDEYEVAFELQVITAFNYNSIWCLSTDGNRNEGWSDASRLIKTRFDSQNSGYYDPTCLYNQFVKYKFTYSKTKSSVTYGNYHGESSSKGVTDNGYIGFGAYAGNLGCDNFYKTISIKKNGITVFNAIPCRRKSDNVAGMWDTVSKTFFTNSGTGNFIAGPDVI